VGLLFTGWMPFQLPHQQFQSNERVSFTKYLNKSENFTADEQFVQFVNSTIVNSTTNYKVFILELMKKF